MRDDLTKTTITVLTVRSDFDNECGETGEFNMKLAQSGYAFMIAHERDDSASFGHG